MKLPTAEKWVDRAVGIWKVFGEWKTPDGKVYAVDVASTDGDVFTELPLDVAGRVVAAHDSFREELYKILCRE